jgi:SHS2 domain-containing protein
LSYAYFEAPGGKGVCATAPTLEEAFTDTAQGVFAMAVDPASIKERDTRVVRAHGADAGDLLVNWLGECLYVLDVEGFAARRVEILAATLIPSGSGGEPLRLHCVLHGEEIDSQRHDPAELSGVDRASVSVKANDEMTEIRVQIRL